MLLGRVQLGAGVAGVTREAVGARAGRVLAFSGAAGCRVFVGAIVASVSAGARRLRTHAINHRCEPPRDAPRSYVAGGRESGLFSVLEVGKLCSVCVITARYSEVLT